MHGVLAEHNVQGVMQQVCGRVGSANARPSPGVDTGSELVARRKSSGFEVADVQQQFTVTLRVGDVEDDSVTGQLADVSYLSAGFSVERCPVEHHGRGR